MAEAVDLAAAVAAPDASWDQGDIVDGVYFAAFDKSMPAVLVTPACDIEQDKVDLWTFVALFPDVDVAKATVAKDLADWNLAPGTAPSKNQRASLAKGERHGRRAAATDERVCDTDRDDCLEADLDLAIEYAAGCGLSPDKDEDAASAYVDGFVAGLESV